MWIERLQQIQFFNRLLLYIGRLKRKKKRLWNFYVPKMLQKNIIINLLFFFCTLRHLLCVLQCSTFSLEQTQTNYLSLCVLCGSLCEIETTNDWTRTKEKKYEKREWKQQSVRERAMATTKKTQNHYRRYFHVAITLHHQRATSDP